MNTYRQYLLLFGGGSFGVGGGGPPDGRLLDLLERGFAPRAHLRGGEGDEHRPGREDAFRWSRGVGVPLKVELRAVLGVDERRDGGAHPELRLHGDQELHDLLGGDFGGRALAPAVNQARRVADARALDEDPLGDEPPRVEVLPRRGGAWWTRGRGRAASGRGRGRGRRARGPRRSRGSDLRRRRGRGTNARARRRRGVTGVDRRVRFALRRRRRRRVRVPRRRLRRVVRERTENDHGGAHRGGR